MSKKRNNAPADLEPVDTEGELIMTCARLLGLWHEREALRAADEWAPDEGPLHPRYAALDKKEGQFRRRLLGLGSVASLLIVFTQPFFRERSVSRVVSASS